MNILEALKLAQEGKTITRKGFNWTIRYSESHGLLRFDNGTESQALVNGGETKEHRQNASIYGNSGGVEQSDCLELTELNNVLNSNNQETDEKNTSSVFCSDPVPLPRMSPKKKSAQESSIMTPSLGKEEPKHEQASLFD